MLVDKADFPPHRCAITGQSEGPFFDSGCHFPMLEGRVYIGQRGVDLIAKDFGLVSKAKYKEVCVELAKARADIKQLEAELEEADKFAQAVDVLESRDFRARKKPGRPKVSA